MPCITAACCAWFGAKRGIRIYTAHQHGPGPADEAARRARIDALVDAAVRIYAPLPCGQPRIWCAGCALPRRSGRAN